MASFSTALSALSALSTAIDVTGNNLANLDTPGFKASVVSFHDLVTESIGAGLGSTQVGFGVGTPDHFARVHARRDSDYRRRAGCGHPGRRVLHCPRPEPSIEYTRGGNFEVDKMAT